jgi:6-phosphogluconate dehydrogenase
MQVGMIGIGRMGGDMVRRLLGKGHQCVVYGRRPEAVAPLVTEGAVGTTTYADFVAGLETPRVVWLMVPAATVDAVLAEVVPLLPPETSLLTAVIHATTMPFAAVAHCANAAFISSM